LIQKNQGQLWEQLVVTTREEIKQNVLQMSLQEPSKLVRHSLAHVISEIAKLELTQQRWQDLVNILYSSCTHADAKHREVGVYVLCSLFEVIADEMEGYVPQILGLFSQTIGDKESLMVAVTTVQGLGKIAEFLDSDNDIYIRQFQSLVPAIVQVLQNCLATGDDEGAAKIFEVFDGLLLLEAPLLSKHFVDLINLFLSIAASADNSDVARVQSLSFLMWCIMSARNKIGKAKLVPNIINAMFLIAAEEELNHDEDEPPRLAIQVINTLATTFPPQQVFPEVMKLAIKGVQSNNAGDRKAAMLSIAVLIEGCADFMRPHLNDVLQLVSHSLQDVDPTVRKAACTCLGALSDDFEDEVSDHHDTLLPLLFNLVNDTDSSLHAEALSTLDVLLEHLGEKIIPYVPGLMSKLVGMWGTGTRKVQISTTNCIGSVAFAAGAEFQPYFTDVMSQLRHLLVLVDPADLQLRSVATDCVGAVATAVGKEAFRSYLPDIMGLAVQGMQYDSSHLRQCSYVLFGVLGRLYEAEFSPYLNMIVPPILQSCDLEENDFGVPEEEDLEIGEEENEDRQFASGIAQEKESSVDTLGELFAATKSAFMPFLPDSINSALTLLSHYHESVRITSANTLLKILNTAYSMAHSEEWEPGLPLKYTPHENVVNIAKLVIEGVVALLADEDERMVVTQVFQSIGETLKICGPLPVSGQCSQESFQGSHVDLLANQLLLVLQDMHPCQSRDESFEEEDEDLAELDALVITAAADTVASLATAIGPKFAVYFEKFSPCIARFFKPSKPLADRSMAIGALAEIVDGIEDGCTPFTNDLMQLFMKGMQDPEDEVRSNAAFGAGVLCTHSTSDVTGYYPQLLPLLHPLFNPNTPTNMQENACGALCRMILRHQALVPLDVCLPILLQSLPLKKDYEENRPVFKALIKLLQDGNSFVIIDSF
jgi:hypothetical protein